MKKQFRLISVLVVFSMLISTICFSAQAQTDNTLFNVNWSGNYLNASSPELEIEIESDAVYIQTVFVAMYDDGFDALGNNKPAFTDYYRMDEVVIKKGETGKVTFNISNTGTPLEDGAYNLLIQGSGKDAALSRVQLPVWVIKPSSIPGIISSFNGAEASGVKTLIDGVKNPLKLDVADSEPTSRLSAFVNIRKVDYQGSFKTLHDIEKAWKISEIISYLSGQTVDKATLRNVFEINASTLGIDVLSADYKAYTSDIYDAIIYNNKQSHADSITKINKLFNESVAIVTINNATNSTISKKLATYYSAAGISESVYKKHTDCNDSETKTKIERMLVNKGFLTAAEIKKTFEDAVDKYITSDTIIIPGGSGGGGGGGGFTPIKGIDSNVNATVGGTGSADKASFNDCSNAHWAYSYVEQLKESGIISGYSDGNFYPDTTVKREEFVKMAVLLAGVHNGDSSCEFEDVLKNEWYYSYVASAFVEGIITGTSDTSFGIGADVSRQDVAVIVCRILKKFGIEASADAQSKVFADEADISDYAAQSVDTLAKLNVLNGFEDGSFKPKASLTRAEAAKIISLVKALIK